MHKALVQRRIGNDARSLEHVAAQGFFLIGYEVETFTRDEWKAGDVEVTKDTVVCGYIGTVLEALDRLQIPRPPNMDYPTDLRDYLHRRLTRITVGEFRHFWSEHMNRKRRDDDWTPPPRAFIKPVHEHKQFTGKVIEPGNSAELGMLAPLPDDFELWHSDVIAFRSEYRFFCRRHEVVGVGHYKGDPTIFPNGAIVRQMAATWQDAPAAWCMDVGVTSNGKTTLVEVNDGHSMGDYGLYPALYARLLEARWCELTGKEPISPW